MSEKELPNYVKEFLIQIINENGIKNYSMEIEPGSKPGDGYTSQILSITVTDRLNDKILNFLCKIAPTDGNLRKLLNTSATYKREALFYNEVMPVFAQFQEEKNLAEIDQFLAYPKCYATIIDDDNEQYAIIMEDLRPQGFEMWDKAKISTIENLRLAMHELGKFHGLSFAMKDQKPNEFAEFMQIDDLYGSFNKTEFIQEILRVNFNRSINSLRNEDHKDILRDIHKNFATYLDFCVCKKTANRFGVLSHGKFFETQFSRESNSNWSLMLIFRRLLDQQHFVPV